MLDWLKRITTPVPGERSGEGQKEHRLERLLDRLETETKAPGDVATEALRRIEPQPEPQPEPTTTETPSPEPLRRIDPLLETGSKKIGDSVDKVRELINRAPEPDGKKPGAPADEVFDLVNPLPNTEPESGAAPLAEPEWEALDETPREPVARAPAAPKPAPPQPVEAEPVEAEPVVAE